MNNNEYNITVNKKNENIENHNGSKGKKLKYNNYINSNHENNINNEEKVHYINNNNNKHIKYNFNNNENAIEKNKRNKNEKIFVIKNDNDIMTYFSKSRNNNRYSINVSNSKPKQKRSISNSIDLIYIFSAQKRENEDTLNDSLQLTSFIGIPFCHYHRFNDQLPKQYVCNYKNCNCYECVDMGKCHKLNDINRPDYIYPINKSKKYNYKYRSVLDKYRKNKSMSTLSEDANQLGSFCLNIMKPNDIDIKISKNNYIDNNIIENEKEKEYSLNESSFLELPFDCNDDKNLKNYQKLVSKSDKKSKIHFSVNYYKKLNKSYNQVYSKDM